MSSAAAPPILTRLEGVRRAASGWMARCPAHQDRTASLSIRVGHDGRVLLNDFHGCTFHEIVRALGLTALDLAPAGARVRRRTRRPFSEREQAIDNVLRAEDRRRERRAPFLDLWRLSDRIRRAHRFARDARRVACLLGPGERVWSVLEGAARQEVYAFAAAAELEQILAEGRIA